MRKPPIREKGTSGKQDKNTVVIYRHEVEISNHHNTIAVESHLVRFQFKEKNSPDFM